MVIYIFDFLFFLLRFNFVKLVILLLENGASVTVRNVRQLTPAHVRKLTDLVNTKRAVFI